MLVLLMGPSGCGKTTMLEMLGYPTLVSTTTRRIRKHQCEVHGVDYNFITETEFVRRLELGEFIEHTNYNGNLYGFLKKDVEIAKDSNVVYINAVDHVGVSAMREYLGKDNVLSVSISATEADLRKWLGKRGDDPKDIESRINHFLEKDEVNVNSTIADVCIPSGNLDEMVKTVKKCIIDKLRKVANGSI